MAWGRPSERVGTVYAGRNGIMGALQERNAAMHDMTHKLVAWVGLPL